MKKNRTNCKTYFTITGNFNPDEITKILGLEPYEFWKIGDKRPDGSTFDFARWSFGRCNEYDVFVDNQVMRTIAPLLCKVDLLRDIREKMDVRFFIVIVAEVYRGDTTPALPGSLEIIDFCHATRTELDIDLYAL